MPNHENNTNIDYEKMIGKEWNFECKRGITIQEFANEHCISYEAVRRQIAHNKKKLYPHMRKDHNTFFLDDCAVQFLAEHRKPQAQPDNTNQIRAQIKQLREDINAKNFTIYDFEKLEELEQKIGSLRNENQILEERLAQHQSIYEKTKQDYQELSEKYIRETSELRATISCTKEHTNFLENLLKILVSKHSHDNDFNLDD